MKSIILVCLGLVFNLSLFAQESKDADEALADKVISNIHGWVLYGVNDYVTAEVSNGNVLLKGWVHGPGLARKVEKIVKRTEGVQTVDNQVQETFGSDELVIGAVRAIYRDQMFAKYFYDVEPPVHVIVMNNKLILAGNVLSSVERNRAEFLVGFYTSAGGIDNQLNVVSHELADLEN